MSSKFSIVKQFPLMRAGYPVPGEYVQEFLDGSKDGEELDTFIRRYNRDPLPAPPPPKPVASIIPPILSDDEPRPTFSNNSAALAASAKPKWEEVYQPSWPGLSATEALS